MYRCLLNDYQRKIVHIFDSFFCEVLDQMDEARVQRWLRRVDIFEKEILMIPAMIDEHWFLIVVRNPCVILDRIDARTGNSNNNGDNIYRIHRKRPAIIIQDSMPGHADEKKPQLIRYVYNFIQTACSIKGKTTSVRDLRAILPNQEFDVKIQVRIISQNKYSK